jgi:hypothetical protein
MTHKKITTSCGNFNKADFSKFFIVFSYNEYHNYSATFEKNIVINNFYIQLQKNNGFMNIC